MNDILKAVDDAKIAEFQEGINKITSKIESEKETIKRCEKIINEYDGGITSNDKKEAKEDIEECESKISKFNSEIMILQKKQQEVKKIYGQEVYPIKDKKLQR